LMTKMSRSKAIFSIIFIVFTAKAQASPVSGLGNGWIFSSLESTRAYLYTPHAMSWAEAEDFCQMVYGHLATDDSAEELRQYLNSANISGAVWIGLHQSKPQTQFTWTNDFDWSEVSMAPGDGWGEYVEEYEAALCVSLDIDHGFRWDTRYCQGVLVAGTVCQIQVPMWVRDGRCTLPQDRENVTLRYYPDQELVQWTTDGEQKTKLCSIEDKLEPIIVVDGECCDNYSVGREMLEKPELTIKEEEINQTEINSKDQVQSFARNNISLLNNATSENNNIFLHNETTEAEDAKNTEDENSKADKITHPPDSIKDKDLTQINHSNEKLSVTVKFEVKNNTSILQQKNTTDQNRSENHSIKKTLTNDTVSKTKKSEILVAAKSSPILNTSMSNSDTLTLSSTLKTLAEVSSTSLISFSTPKLSTTEAVSGATVHRIFSKHILNRTQQTSDETTRKVPTEKSKFSHLQDVTILQIIPSVTPELTNSTVEIPPKVSISTDIFNTSQASTFKEVNETWPSMSTEAVTERETRKAEEKTTKESIIILSRHKRSSGQRNPPVKNKRKEVSRTNRNNRQLRFGENGIKKTFDRTGA